MKKLNILIGEDDIDDSMLFTQALEELQIDCDVIIAEDGLQLINKVNDGVKPDIIFLDINMPFKSGIECLGHIRAKGEMEQVPVIIYSTSHNKKEIQTCFEMGATHYVVKPFSFGAIMKMIDGFCRRQWNGYSNDTFDKFIVSFE